MADTYVQVETVLSSMPGAVEEAPFGPDARVFKVGGKMFAILSGDRDSATVSLKVDPLEGEALRDTWEAIIPGYHLNKRHWITIHLDGTVPDALVNDQCRESYDLVVQGLTRAARAAIPWGL
jgi:predicted DNA-binding protein (MmcQ/YjbR family)